MDPSVVRALAEVIGPAIAMLVLGSIPISIVFMNRYFKLKTREMELDAEMHGREMEGRLRALEARQGSTESAITALANSVPVHRASMMEPPPDSETQAVPQPRRTAEK